MDPHDYVKKEERRYYSKLKNYNPYNTAKFKNTHFEADENNFKLLEPCKNLSNLQIIKLILLSQRNNKKFDARFFKILLLNHNSLTQHQAKAIFRTIIIYKINLVKKEKNKGETKC